ncbi:DUF4198 domain-containing protein [Noviherbaspirillum suwonense]|uniref:Uncharacterized conserved protein, contains GH25 family domain n=1 Tax=Noviherbaspirillum suwonense TaxID=1224511 RepID=A0ABY1Q2P8_9BURK|nr:DUF4198 domain-containing protein [Noviherbaspirillum suwonense]SMP57314.1 Uncharacterized conserved protein, contains GH25 family domain [Noviherbaspirillum suwonense]
MRTRLKTGLLATLFAVLAPLAHGHEFWLEAQPFTPAAGASAAISLHVGENFDGELTPLVDERTAALRHYSAGSVVDLMPRLPRRTALPRLDVPIANAGSHLIAFDSQPITFTLSVDKFQAYLHDEGLDYVIEQREAAGKAAAPGRERYRRHVKSLLKSGGVSDDTYAVRTGQRLEITALSDPYAARPGSTLRFRLTFENRPLANALVKGWHKHDSQLLLIKARTDAAGEVALSLPYAGEWMVSVVHMTPAKDAPNADWDSFWGNLTFALPAP